MQIVALKPQRMQLIALMVCLGLMALGTALFPAMAVVFALLMPLFSCPLAGHRQHWAALAASVAPTLISLLNGYDTLYAVSLLVLTGAPLAVAYVLAANKNQSGSMPLGAHIAACAAGLAVVIACATHALGGNLPTGLADLLTQRVSASAQPGMALYRLATAGLLNVPNEYRGASLLVYLLEPALIRQMLMSLHLTLEILFRQSLPSAFVQAGVICGLFTALRARRLNTAMLIVFRDARNPNKRQTRVAQPLGFSSLTLPRSLSRLVTGMGLCSILLIGTGSQLMQTLGLLFYAMFNTVFQLCGAAVIVGVLSARNPERKPLYGSLAAILYVLFPLALFLIGILDPALHFRKRLKEQPEKEEE